MPAGRGSSGHVLAIAAQHSCAIVPEWARCRDRSRAGNGRTAPLRSVVAASAIGVVEAGFDRGRQKTEHDGGEGHEEGDHQLHKRDRIGRSMLLGETRMNEKADRGAHAHGCKNDDGVDWILHARPTASRADLSGGRFSRAGRRLPRIESDRMSMTAASVLIGKINSSLNLSHRVFDEAHGPLAMATFVWRRRLQGLERRAKRARARSILP